MIGALRKRGTAPAPFHQTIGKLCQRLPFPHSMVAELLQIPESLLAAWLLGDKVPHRLMQIGAVDVLGAKIAYMRKGQNAREWIVKTPDGVEHRTPELTDWIKQNYPSAHAANVAAALGQRGQYKKLGLSAKKYFTQ